MWPINKKPTKINTWLTVNSAILGINDCKASFQSRKKKKKTSILRDVAVRQACLASTSCWVMVNLFHFLFATRRERDHGEVKYKLTHTEAAGRLLSPFKLWCPPCGHISKHPWQNDTTSCLSSSITRGPRRCPVEALLNIYHGEVSPGRQAGQWHCLAGWLPKSSTISSMQTVSFDVHIFAALPCHALAALLKWELLDLDDLVMLPPCGHLSLSNKSDLDVRDNVGTRGAAAADV